MMLPAVIASRSEFMTPMPSSKHSLVQRTDILSFPFWRLIDAGVTTVCVPIADDVKVQDAPGTLGVFTTTNWVVPFVIVAHAPRAIAATARPTIRMSPPIPPQEWHNARGYERRDSFF